MSYQFKRSDVQVVVCDICGEFSWVSDRHWRQMPQGSPDKPIHLCPSCQRHAIWCAGHQQYHLPDALHRLACVDCGGLFTSVVSSGQTRCPTCWRAASEGQEPAQPPAPHRRTLAQRLLAPWGNLRR